MRGEENHEIKGQVGSNQMSFLSSSFQGQNMETLPSPALFLVSVESGKDSSKEGRGKLEFTFAQQVKTVTNENRALFATSI